MISFSIFALHKMVLIEITASLVLIFWFLWGIWLTYKDDIKKIYTVFEKIDNDFKIFKGQTDAVEIRLQDQIVELGKLIDQFTHRIKVAELAANAIYRKETEERIERLKEKRVTLQE